MRALLIRALLMRALLIRALLIRALLMRALLIRALLVRALLVRALLRRALLRRRSLALTLDSAQVRRDVRGDLIELCFGEGQSAERGPILAWWQVPTYRRVGTI